MKELIGFQKAFNSLYERFLSRREFVYLQIGIFFCCAKKRKKGTPTDIDTVHDISEDVKFLNLNKIVGGFCVEILISRVCGFLSLLCL